MEHINKCAENKLHAQSQRYQKQLENESCKILLVDVTRHFSMKVNMSISTITDK